MSLLVSGDGLISQASSCSDVMTEILVYDNELISSHNSHLELRQQNCQPVQLRRPGMAQPLQDQGSGLPEQICNRFPPGYTYVSTLYQSEQKAVLRAIRDCDGSRVVIKMILSPTSHSIERLDREAVFLRRLHATERISGICSKIAEYLKEDACIILVDEGGKAISSLLAEDSAIRPSKDIDTLLHISIQLSIALSIVHANRIIHNDIKPRNLLFVPQQSNNSERARILLLDFDLAETFAEATLDVKKNGCSGNSPIGTLEYMSPEQTGQLALRRDYRTDLYSLGVVLYQLSVSKLPYSGETLRQTLQAILTVEPSPLHEQNSLLPRSFSDIVARLLAKNPDQRYQSAYGLCYDLQRCKLEWVQQQRESSSRTPSLATSFPLASRDSPIVLRLPKALFGREREMQQLREMYASLKSSTSSSEHHHCKCMLLSGIGGVGKTTLFSELQATLGNSCTFLSGKFEENRRLVPFSAFRQALASLARQLILLPTGEQTDCKQRLAAAVGSNGQVLTQAFPELMPFMETKRDVIISDLAPAEAQTRFTNTFISFFKVFAQREKPLVYFLDDLQWADVESLRLWQAILIADIPYLFLVGAYRDNEVSSDHLLMKTLENVRTAAPSVTVNVLHLTPLDVTSIRQLLASTIRLDENDEQKLAELLLRKTLGNPFFLARYLLALYSTELLQFDWRTGRWTYDEQKIAQEMLAENAAQLMAASMSRLDEKLLQPLLKASCIGVHFAVPLLASITATSEEADLRQTLSTLNELAYIYQLSQDEFKFSHDHVHAAAYSLITSTTERNILHLKIARSLLHSFDGNDVALHENLFDVVTQFNLGSRSIETDDERIKIAELNLSASEKAAKTSGHASARSFASAGIALLRQANEKHHWETHHTLSYRLYLQHAVSSYVDNAIAESNSSFAEVISHASSFIEKEEACMHRVLVMFQAGKHREAMLSGLECLAFLGVTIPFEPSDAQVAAVLEEFENEFAARRMENMQSMADGFQLSTFESAALQHCFAELTAPSFFISPNICAVVAAQGSLVTLRRGLSPHSAIGLIFLAWTFSMRGKTSIAYDVGRLAVAMVDRFPNSIYRGKVYFLFGAHINWMRSPISADLPFLRTALQSCVNAYDSLYAAFAAFHVPFTVLVSGDSLEAGLHEVKKSHDLLCSQLHVPDVQTGVDALTTCFTALSLGASALASPSYFTREHVLEYERFLLSRNVPLSTGVYYSCKVFALYHLERYEDAIAAAKLMEPLVVAVRGHLLLPCLYYSHLALAHLALWNDNTGSEALAAIETTLAALEQWVALSPINFTLVLKLVRARYIEVVRREYAAALRMYDEAVAEAEERGYRYWHALGCATSASCAAAAGLKRNSRQLLAEACKVYAAWGAMTPVAVLTRRHALKPPLSARRSSSSSANVGGTASGGSGSGESVGGGSGVVTTTTSSSGNATLAPFSGINAQLDADTVLQVARALSQEIVLEKLLPEVMRILTENTAADYVCLALEGEKGIEIVAQMGSLRNDEPDKNTTEIIRHVHLLREILSIDNAFDDQRFPLPDVNRYASRAKSVFCVPLQKSATVNGVLYLENSRFAAAFSPARVQIVHAIVPQITICIENARLVQRLRATKEELEVKNEALKRQDIQKDQFLATTTHELRTPLHAIISATSMLLDTSTLNVQQREYGNVILTASTALLTLVNDILDLAKIQAATVSIDRRFISVISVVESAIELVSGVAAEKEIDLAYVLEDDLSKELLFETDPSRLQQIITNLLANALKFTQRGYVLVTIKTTKTESNNDEAILSISVRDTGIGIPPEYIPHVFEIFSQLDNPHKSRYDGFGIGLFVCRRLVDLLGGSLVASSDGHSGSLFNLTLPLRATAAPPEEQQSPLLSSSNNVISDASSRPMVLLWVEHQHTVRVLTDALVSASVQVQPLCSSVAEVMRATTTDAPTVLFAELGNVAALKKELANATLTQRMPVIIALAFAKTWSNYAHKEGLVVLFKPVLRSKVLPLLCSAMSSSLLLTPTPPAAAAPPPLSSPPSTLSTPATPRPDATLPPSPSPLRVLIVEDNPLSMKILSRILEGHYTTVTAPNGKEAITAVMSSSPDVILMDIQMPVMDGITATKELRRLGHHMPIIATTASFSAADREKCLAVGMNDILPKPFTRQAVLAVVKSTLAEQTNKFATKPPTAAP